MLWEKQNYVERELMFERGQVKLKEMVEQTARWWDAYSVCTEAQDSIPSTPKHINRQKTEHIGKTAHLRLVTCWKLFLLFGLQYFFSFFFFFFLFQLNWYYL